MDAAHTAPNYDFTFRSSSISHCLMARDEMTTGKMPSSKYLALQAITHAVRPRNGNEFADLNVKV